MKTIQLNLISNKAEKGVSLINNVNAQSVHSDSSSDTSMLLGFGKEIKIKGHRIGHLDNGIFITERKRSKLFRQYKGWGISKQLIFELVSVSTKKILFNIVDDDRTLLYTLEVAPINWQRRGIDYHNPALDEDQLILPETSFDRRIENSVRVIR